MKKMIFLACIALALISAPSTVFAHCQIPCGIYDDDMRFKMIEEDISTVEKSVNEIVKLSVAENKDFNQIVRWVNNKDEHADKISEIVTYYFMAQRLKPANPSDAKEYGAYVTQLSLLHEILYYSMKAKQGTDLAAVTKMREALEKYRIEYNKGK